MQSGFVVSGSGMGKQREQLRHLAAAHRRRLADNTKPELAQPHHVMEGLRSFARHNNVAYRYEGPRDELPENELSAEFLVGGFLAGRGGHDAGAE